MAAWPRPIDLRERAACRRRARHCQSGARTRARPGRVGPLVEILEEHDEYPSALPARREVDHSAWITIHGCGDTKRAP